MSRFSIKNFQEALLKDFIDDSDDSSDGEIEEIKAKENNEIVKINDDLVSVKDKMSRLQSLIELDKGSIENLKEFASWCNENECPISHLLTYTRTVMISEYGTIIKFFSNYLLKTGNDTDYVPFKCICNEISNIYSVKITHNSLLLFCTGMDARLGKSSGYHYLIGYKMYARDKDFNIIKDEFKTFSKSDEKRTKKVVDKANAKINSKK